MLYTVGVEHFYLYDDGRLSLTLTLTLTLTLSLTLILTLTSTLTPTRLDGRAGGDAGTVRGGGPLILTLTRALTLNRG